MAAERGSGEHLALEAVRVLRQEVLASGKWLRLGVIEYARASAAGRVFTWETVERTTRRAGQVDGVDVLALVGEGAARGEVEAGGAAKDDGVRGQRLAVIINYRPSVAQHVLEFPAGLVDQDETPARAAERELKEETGLDGRCASCSPPLLVDPWKSNESLRLAHVELPEDAAPRAQSLEENESILLLLLPLRGLLDELRRLMRQHGLGIDGKLFAFALGLEVARSGRIPPLE